MQPTRLLLAVISLAACGGGAPTTLDLEREELDGTWQSPCFPTSATQSAKTVLAYKDLQLTGTYHEYSDTACTAERHQSVWTGAAAGGEEVKSGVRKLDLVFTSFHSKPLTQAEADMVNSWHYCGISDWAPGVERDVMGKDCVNFSIPTAGVSLDIYQREGTSIRFGKGSKIAASLTEADRPTELSEAPFAKQ